MGRLEKCKSTASVATYATIPSGGLMGPPGGIPGHVTIRSADSSSSGAYGGGTTSDPDEIRVIHVSFHLPIIAVGLCKAILQLVYLSFSDTVW